MSNMGEKELEVVRVIALEDNSSAYVVRCIDGPINQGGTLKSEGGRGALKKIVIYGSEQPTIETGTVATIEVDWISSAGELPPELHPGNRLTRG